MAAAAGRFAAGRSAAGRLTAGLAAGFAATAVVTLLVAALLLFAARLTAAGRLAAGGSGAAGRLTASGSGTAGRLAAGRLTARVATAATVAATLQETGLSVVREVRNGAGGQQQGKQDFRFHGESSNNRNRLFVFSPRVRLPSNTHATILTGSNRQTLPMALARQSGFPLFRSFAAHRP